LGPSLDQVLACPHLPTLPNVAVSVLELARDEHVSVAELARAIQHDQALCVKILKTVNSPFYGLVKPCPTINRAIAYLGIDTVKSLVLGFSLVKSCEQREQGFDMVGHWRRAVYSATAARQVATLGRIGAADAEEVFVAGLMQDIGMMALHTVMKAEYGAIISAAGTNHHRLPEAERDHLGFDHAEVGAGLAARWRLPTSLIECIRHHHDCQTADQAGAESCKQAGDQLINLIRAVILGGYIAGALSEEDAPSAIDRFTRCAAVWLKIERCDMGGLMRSVTESATQIAQCLHVDTGEVPDINTVLAQAEDAAVQHHLRIQRETERLRGEYAKLSEQAMTDALTGLGNRHCFDRELAFRFEQARGTGLPLALLVADADKFKDVNDTHGHQAGDAVLVELGARMRSAVGTAGLVCRYGGEEMVVLLGPGADADRSTAATVAESVRLAMADKPVDLRAVPGSINELTVTMSVGVAVLDSASSSVFTSHAMLMEAADRALYAAKQAGRNCVRVFSPRPRPATSNEQPAAQAA
jgi:two-component system, cell cycle response regulator